MSLEVRFGNLSVEQFAKKTEVEFSEEDKKWLEENRTDSANYEGHDKFHIFDMPLGIYSGFDVYEELVKRLRKYDFKKQFSVEQKVKETDESAS